MDDERTMTFLARHRKEQRRRKAVIQAYIDRQARKTGACLHCPWHTTGAACVLPRCFKPRGKEKDGD